MNKIQIPLCKMLFHLLNIWFKFAVPGLALLELFPVGLLEFEGGVAFCCCDESNQEITMFTWMFRPLFHNFSKIVTTHL